MKKSKLNTLITELYKEGAQQELRMEIRRLIKEQILLKEMNVEAFIDQARADGIDDESIAAKLEDMGIPDQQISAQIGFNEATIRKGGKEYYVTYDPDTGEEQLEPTTAHIVKQEATATKDIYLPDIAGGVTISDKEEIDAYNSGEIAFGTDRDGKDHEVQKQ